MLCYYQFILFLYKIQVSQQLYNEIFVMDDWNLDEETLST